MDAPTPVTCSCDLPFSSAKSPVISGTVRNVATFPLPLQRRLVTDKLHIRQLGRRDRVVTPTLTLVDLGLLLWR